MKIGTRVDGKPSCLSGSLRLAGWSDGEAASARQRLLGRGLIRVADERIPPSVALGSKVLRNS